MSNTNPHTNFSTSDKIALASLIVAIVGVVVAILIPDIRCFFGLQEEQCEVKTTDCPPYLSPGESCDI